CLSRPEDGHAGRPARPPGNAQNRGRIKGAPPITLNQDQSAALRDKLLTELAEITSADPATSWARDALSAKNILTAADAKRVEDAFEQKHTELLASEAAGAPTGNSPSSLVANSPGVT